MFNNISREQCGIARRTDVYHIGGRSLSVQEFVEISRVLLLKEVKYATSETFVVGDAVRRVFFGVNVIETLLLYVLSVARIVGVTEKKEKRDSTEFGGHGTVGRYAARKLISTS